MEAAVGVLPEPPDGRARDHVPAPDMGVASALRELLEAIVSHVVGEAIADHVDPHCPRLAGSAHGCDHGDDCHVAGYTIEDEFTHQPNQNNRGTISMANAGPNTGGSQFFINLVNNNFLDGKHPVFGEVVEGMEVVDKIAKLQTDANDRPVEEVKIIEAKII